MSSSTAMDVSELLEATSSKQLAIQVPKEIPVEIDLGLMAILDPNPIEDEVYKMDREQTLLSHARDGIQLLVNGIWNQPTRLVDDGVVADLPPISTELPREKPLPKAKAMTKWQAFATAKGIAPKPKKDRMVFDEEKQDWVPRWGYKGKNKESEDQWITEVPDHADNSFDPVANSKQKRTARKAKNETQRLKNMQRAAANAATQVATNQANASEREKRKVQLDRELKITKKATASMGKFDAQLKGENAEKNVKRKFDPNEVDAKAERNKAMSILTKIGATPSNKRTKVSDDAPTAGKDVSAGSMINERKAIKHLTGGRGALSMGQRGGRGGKGGGRGGGRGGRGRK